MAEQHWTALLVEDRLEEAADTLSRLPDEHVRGYFSTWPPVIRDYWEAFGREDVRLRRGPPSPAAIDRMDETMTWLRWLEPDDARLVWARAEGLPWKSACYRFGLSRAAIWRHWVASLQLISIFLNGHPVRPWSRMTLVEMWQAANAPAKSRSRTGNANHVKTMETS